MASPERGGRRSVVWAMRLGLVQHVLFVLAVAAVLVMMIPGTLYSAVDVARAEIDAGNLRIEGSALPNRTITVNGIAMGTSRSDGTFRFELPGFVAPDDCTVAVNDGWAAPAKAHLTGCTVIRR